MEANVDERRKDSRVPYITEIYCSKCISEERIKRYDPPLVIQVVNISIEGLCICTTEDLKEGSLIEFNMALEEILYKSLSATIIWGLKSDKINVYGVHINNITGKFGTHILQIEQRLSTRI